VISLMCLLPQQHDATSFYRGAGPLGSLKRQRGDLTLSFPTGAVNWSHLNMVDAVFMQRPFQPTHLELAKMAKRGGRPLWIDYDDDLFNVPTDNPTHTLYSRDQVQKNIAQIVAMADVVTVSTSELKRRLDPLNEDIRIVPNAIDEELFGYRSWEPEKRSKCVMWRGSATHARDLAIYSSEIIELAHEFPEWTWTFLGTNPWFITDAIPSDRCTVIEPLDVLEYFEFIHGVRARVQMVPLHDSPFNRAKSNIAWIEGTFAGSACVVPNWEEWQRPGVFAYKSKESFKRQMSLLLSEKEPELELVSVRASWDHVTHNLRLERVNHLRSEVIDDLVPARPAYRRGPSGGLD
jgi:hypothetical protein